MSDTPGTPESGAPADTPAAPAPAASAPLTTPPTTAPVALPAPVPQAAGVQRNSARTGIVVGAVVGVVAVVGGVVALLNRSSSEAVAAPEPTVIQPAPPSAPATPDAGSVPTPVTLPGPSIDSTVAPPTTAAPATTAAPIEPPATVPPTVPPSSTGETITMDDGVSFTVPNGWSLVTSKPNFAVLTAASAAITLNVLPTDSDGATNLAAYQSLLAERLLDLQVSDIQPTQIYSSTVVDSATFAYLGYLDQGNAGTTYVQGTVFGEVKVSGYVIVTDLMYVPDSSGGISAADSAGITEFLASFSYGN